MVRAIVDDVRGGCGGRADFRAVSQCDGRSDRRPSPDRAGLERVVSSGGCFQHRYLLERTVARLEAEGLRPAWPQRVPPNDGGIALGQVVAVRWDMDVTEQWLVVSGCGVCHA